jgi:hypothetical protein
LDTTDAVRLERFFHYVAAPFRSEQTMRADIVPGVVFPDYELTDHTKTRRRLSELQGIDPMILVLSRGGFCPKDHQQHLELAAGDAPRGIRGQDAAVQPGRSLKPLHCFPVRASA